MDEKEVEAVRRGGAAAEKSSSDLRAATCAVGAAPTINEQQRHNYQHDGPGPDHGSACYQSLRVARMRCRCP